MGGTRLSEQPIRVTAAIVEHGGRFLVARRRHEGVRGGLWEFPGGKVEPGEDDRTALARELEEELGVQVAPGDALGTVDWSYPDVTIRLVGYWCTIIRGTPTTCEHEEVRWVNREELSGLAWCEADAPLVAALVRGER